MQKELDMESIRKKFFAQVEYEYHTFRTKMVNAGLAAIYDNSLKVTFYKEIYRYLMDDVLSEKEYMEFCGEPVLQKLWDIYVTSELPRQTRDYLRQLINLYRDNERRRYTEK